MYEEARPLPVDRGEWLRALDSHTERWREWRAADLEQRGDRSVLVQAASDECEDSYASIGPALWYRQRANAHRVRFDRLGECATRERLSGCDCGKCQSCTRLFCDHWRLCLSCRGRRARKYREKLESGRRACLREHADKVRRLDAHRWSERFLTLTVPHSGSVSADVVALRSAWAPFAQSLRRYLARSGFGWKGFPYWRSLEVTASDDGHAHYHVWLLGPYLPRELLRHWWAAALPEEYRSRVPRVALVDALAGTDTRNHAEIRRAARVEDPFWSEPVAAAQSAARLARHRYGRGDARSIAANAYAVELRDQCAWLYAPVLDVRKISHSDDLSKYMTKGIVNYLVKDAAADGERMAVPVFAAIYAALEGVRVVATSVHWAPLPDARTLDQKRFCGDCGAEYSVRFLDAAAPARAPPALPFIPLE